MGQLVPQHDLNESSQISLRSAQLSKQFVGGHSMAPWSRKRQRSRPVSFRLRASPLPTWRSHGGPHSTYAEQSYQRGDVEVPPLLDGFALARLSVPRSLW